MNIKTRKEILSELILWMRNNTSEVTDFNQGSVMRCIFNSVASQLGQLYYDTYRMFRGSRIIFANGSDLDIAVADRSIKRKGATKASVQVKFTGIIGTVIPIGTKTATDQGIEFLSKHVPNLEHLCIAACYAITGKSIPFFAFLQSNLYSFMLQGINKKFSCNC